MNNIYKEKNISTSFYLFELIQHRWLGSAGTLEGKFMGANN